MRYGDPLLKLSERGYHCVGIDVSEEMISIAREKVKGNVPVFLVQDMRSLDLDDGFDMTICMFGGFGYLDTDRDLSRFFSGLSRILKPEGLFLFEFWNIGGLEDSPYRTWMKVDMGEGAYLNLSESRYFHDRSVLEISIHHFLIRDRALGENFVEEHSMRIYSLQEIQGLLAFHGFRLLEAFDRKNLDSFVQPSKETFRIFAVSKLWG